MGNEQKQSFNWEKIGVYIAVMTAFFSIVFYFFQIKDDITDVRERISKLEVKVEHLDKK